MKYIVFKTVNMADNDRELIGIHGCEEPNIFDNYLGESVYVDQASTFMYPKTPFQCAVKRYGTKSFERHTLEVFDTFKEAVDYYRDITTKEYIDSIGNYNMDQSDDIFKPVYVFSRKGKFLKKWNSILDAVDLYGWDAQKFIYAIYYKYEYLGFYWSFGKRIDINEYAQRVVKYYYQYSLEGKCLRCVYGTEMAANLLDTTTDVIINNTKTEVPIGSYYISDKLTDTFKPRPRRAFKSETMWVYRDGKCLGSFVGKEVFKVLDMHSFTKLYKCYFENNHWYKDYYISLEPLKEIPEKIPAKGFDIYTNDGNYIETLLTPKEIREKYNITSAQLNRIIRGNKYGGQYIIKYHK